MDDIGALTQHEQMVNIFHKAELTFLGQRYLLNGLNMHRRRYPATWPVQPAQSWSVNGRGAVTPDELDYLEAWRAHQFDRSS